MSDSTVVVRLKVGENEIEIRSKKEDLKEVLGVIQGLLDVFAIKPMAKAVQVKEVKENPPKEVPEIKVEKNESLPSVILKMFSTDWGRKPRRLMDVKEALESYGLIYPKQSVAVALLRLAKSGKLRRFKGEGEEYVYTASTELLAER